MSEPNVSGGTADYGNTTDHDKEIWRWVQNAIDESGHTASDAFAHYRAW